MNKLCKLVLVMAFFSLTACGGSSSGDSSNDGTSGTTNDVPTVDAGADQTVSTSDTVTLSATIVDDDTTTISWAQTSGGSVTLSSTTDASITFTAPAAAETLEFEISVDDGVNAVVTDTITVSVIVPAELPTAFLSFGANVTVVVDGDEVVLEATGRPDHTSPYWNPDNASGLYVAPDPDITTVAQMSPGYIEEYNNLYTLRVPVNPTQAGNSSSTSLGAVGIAVSGAPIFNDQEGPNNNLDIGVIMGFDRSGAHTGPETYHYHLEPKAFSDDDSELIGVIADGFLIYGRQCYSTPGTYPTDLDASGGHTSITQHTGAADGDEVYHYHVQDEFYLNEYYLLFPGDYQGSPNSISN